MDTQNNQNNNKNSNTAAGIAVVVIIVLIILMFKACGSSSSTSTKTTAEVRCWYCSKVIYNNGKPIHCKPKYNTPTTSWTCDYCGKTNSIK